MRNIVTPGKAISFEQALRRLAGKLTGVPAAELPRTQEAIVQFMAETIPSMEQMREAVMQEVLARLAARANENPEQEQAASKPRDGAKKNSAAVGASAGRSHKTTKNS